MSDRSLSVIELNSLLLRRGHRLWKRGEEDPEGVEVCPPSDVIVTVALNLDPCQVPVYRDRYFATLVDDDRFPLLGYEPHFELPEPFLQAAAQERRSYGAFMAGPFRWLIRRLMRFPRWLLWPEDQIRAMEHFVRDHWVLEEMPRLSDWLQRNPPVPPTAGALILNPTDRADSRVLWEVAEQVETSFYNYYVSDPDGVEVFELHHHSKVTISIPDENERRRLLNELSGYPDLLEDCSGYTSEIDDEWE
jgi:hypothetical protein